MDQMFNIKTTIDIRFIACVLVKVLVFGGECVCVVSPNVKIPSIFIIDNYTILIGDMTLSDLIVNT